MRGKTGRTVAGIGCAGALVLSEAVVVLPLLAHSFVIPWNMVVV